MKKGFAIGLIIAILGCTDGNDNLLTFDLSGKWIEIGTRSDTLDFGSLGTPDIMYLGRGEEVLDGILKPKYKSGPYEYKLSEAKISLRWLLSSNSDFEEYSFKIAGETLQMGNFYGSASGANLTFQKLE